MKRPWIILPVVFFAIAACTEVGPVSRQESLLSVGVPDSMFPNLQRTRRWEGRDLVEEWSWRNGELYISLPARSQYYTNDYSDKEDLIADVDTWPALRNSGVTLNRRNILTGTNSIGDFQYAVSELDDRGERCFIMLQGKPYSAGASFEAAPSPEASEGLVSLYECRSAASMTAEELEDRLLTIVEALRFTP